MFLISLVDVKLYLIFGKRLFKVYNRYSRGLRLLSMNYVPSLSAILSILADSLLASWITV